MSFAKLHRCIITSSIFEQPENVFKTWIALLAMADKDGFVNPTASFISNIAKVPIEKIEEALVKLCEPDPKSRTKDNEGRRLSPMRDGWLILNYAKYRDMCGPNGASRAEYFRDYRAKKRAEDKAIRKAIEHNKNDY